jgi:ubiquinone/menaquinone biosynthesis C-methylase UbiE
MLKFAVADATALPFEAEAFDGVFSFESLHHFVDCSRAVDEMYRVCRPGGVISVADLNLDGLRAVRETIQMLTGRSHEENPCRIAELERLLSQFNHVARHDLPFMSVFTVRKRVLPIV